MPSRNRSTLNVRGVRTNIMDMASKPHVNMMRANQRRAPKRSSSKFDGTSHKAYPIKNSPAPSPYTEALKCKSRFICREAKLMLMRSM